MSDQEITFAKESNDKGRCGGCQILIYEMEKDKVLDDRSVYYFENIAWCFDCYQRRKRHIPIKKFTRSFEYVTVKCDIISL